MPIYEYQCQECGHQLEALQKISDDPLTECPECHKSGLQKLVSAASFRLKGGGWYETDFKSGKKKHLADSDAGDKAGNSNAGAGKSKAGSGSESAMAEKSKNGSGGDTKPADTSKTDSKKASKSDN